LSFDAASNVAGNNNLIGVAGVGNFTLTGTGNLTGTQAAPLDAGLGPLANNGGPTMTRALLTGSPAIDAGDPAAVAGVGNVPQFDQRGATFTRKFNSTGIGTARIDIGAFELQVQPLTPAFFGDYNQNSAVDAGDYVLWRKTLGTTAITAYSGADGDGDTTIDQDDHSVWRAHFGQTVPPPGSGGGDASSVQIQELKADPPRVRNIAADYIGEPVIHIPAETISAPAETDAVAVRSATFAALETRSPGHDSSSRSRRRIDRFQVADSGDDGLPLLLAIDRVGRTTQQDSFANDDSGNGECRAADDDSASEIDEPLGVAFAIW
jgi:hypothetical protein